MTPEQREKYIELARKLIEVTANEPDNLSKISKIHEQLDILQFGHTVLGSTLDLTSEEKNDMEMWYAKQKVEALNRAQKRCSG